MNRAIFSFLLSRVYLRDWHVQTTADLGAAM